MKPALRRTLSILIRATVAVFFIAAAAGVVALLMATKPQVRTVDPTAQLPRIEVLAAEKVSVQRQWLGFGTARAKDAADVPARITATVTDIPDRIEEGKRVNKGELLVQLDKSDFERQVEIAEETIQQIQAQLTELDVEQQRLTERIKTQAEVYELVTAEFERVQRLFEQQAASQRDVDAARRAQLEVFALITQLREAKDRLDPRRQQLRANLAAQQANLSLARENLSRCSIRSPLDGILQAVDVEIGENLGVGMRVARVVSLDKIEVPLNLPASARRFISRGDEAELTTTSPRDKTWRATISRIAPEDDPATRTFTAYVEFDQSEQVAGFAEAAGRGLLLPGVFVRGRVRSQSDQPRWVLPRRSIRGGRIFTVRDGVITSRAVEVAFAIDQPIPQLGAPDRQWAVLAEPPAVAETPLESGELVVLNLTSTIADGDRIEPVVINRDTLPTPRREPDRPATAAKTSQDAKP